MSIAFLRALNVGPAAYQAKTPWGPWSATGATLAMFAVAASVSLVLCDAVLAAVGAESIMESIRAGGTGESTVRNSLIWTIGMQALLVLLILLVSRFFKGNPLDVLALRRPAQGWGVLVPSFLVLLCVVGVYSTITYLAWPSYVLADLKPFQKMLHSDSGALLAVAGAVGAPFSEEMLWRGFLLSALARTPIGFLGAALVANVAWTALHAQYSLVGLVDVFVVGLVQSWLLWRTGSLWVPIICHAIYNGLVLFTLLMFPLALVALS